MATRSQLFIILLLLLIKSHLALGSGFLQWTRSYEGYVNVSSSASDISVVVGPSPTESIDGTYIVSILNSTTGVSLVNATIDGQREAIVIRPQVNQAGAYSCIKLGETADFVGNFTAVNWCAIFLVSPRYNNDPLILFPTGVVRPLQQAPAPWVCTETSRCLVRNTEQQTKSIGGCFRRSDPWPFLSSELAPQSTHVTLVDSNGDIFSFRPLDVALGSGTIKKVTPPVPIWKSDSIGWDSSIQYLALTYSTRVTGIGSEALRQDAICALAIVGSNGALALYDADRNNASTPTGLPLLGLLDNNFNTNITNISSGYTSEKVCYPFVQAVRRMEPGRSSLYPNPLFRKVYGTVLAINCKNGQGWFWDMQTSTIFDSQLHEPVTFSWNPVGTFNTPPAFDPTIASLSPLDPLGMDIEITLVQPTVTFVTGSQMATVPGDYLQYVTSIAALRYLPNVYSLSSNDGSDCNPTVALITFLSNMSGVKSVPNLTTTLVGSATVRELLIQVDSTLLSIHNVTHSIGWVAASGLPAQFNVTIPSNLSKTAALDLEREVIVAASNWFANFGIVYSIISDTVHVMLNCTTGLPVAPSDLIVGNASTLFGGVKQAGMVRLDPYTNAMALSPILDWQDGTTNVNRSVFHNRATILTPSALSPDQPTCVYSLAANDMGISFYIFVTMSNAVNTNITGNWTAIPANQALFNPYTQNFCMATIVASASVALEMVPAGRAVYIVQVSSIDSEVLSRVTVNPLRDVIAQTAQVSYSLDRNASNQTALLHPQTLHPTGTPMIYVCGQRRLFAYYGSIGNTSWEYDFSNLTGCETCVCNQGDQSLLLSMDRQFVVLIVNNELGDNVAEAIVILNAADGSLLRFIDAGTIASRSTECAANVVPQFGQMQEISISAADITGFVFIAIAAMTTTRCFVYITVSREAGINVGEMYVFFFLGSSPVLTSNIEILQGTAYLSTSPEMPNWWAGHYVYGIDVKSGAATMLTSPPANPIGALPTFAANSVISCVAFGSMLFAVQVVITSGNYVILVLNTFVPSVSSTASWSATLNHFPPAKYPEMQNVSVFIMRNIFVCVASGPLQCYAATPTGGGTSYYLDGTLVQHFGMPALDQWGAMIFATPPYQPHAIRFSAQDLFPAYAWTGLTWPGSDEGVEMNVDQSSCTDPQITNQGLVMVCGLHYDPLGTQSQRHMVFIESTTGQLLLADGPWAKPNTVIVSDSGIQIVYVNNLATAVSIQFVAFQQLVPLHFTGSLCRQQPDAVYSLNVLDGYFTAQKTPTNASQPIITLNYYQQTYAYEWIGYMGLRLGRTYVVQSPDVVASLYQALPPIVIAVNSLHFFVGNTLSIMNSDFNIALMDSSMCDLCAAGCPTSCTVELTTGNQFEYEFTSTNYLTQYITTPKPNGTGIYLSNFATPTYETFSGSVAIDMARTLSSLSISQEVVTCINTSDAASFTQMAPDGQFCMLDPRLNFKRWVIVQISSGLFASTTMFSAPWNADNSYTESQLSMLTPPLIVDENLAIVNMLNKAIKAGSFPDEFTTTTSSTIASATINENGNETTLTIVTSTKQQIVLSNLTCTEMEEDIPFCLDELLHFTDDMADPSMVTVTWVGSEDSNWGEGFISSGYRTQLSTMMRTPTKGAPMRCGDLNTACTVSCQPTVTCASQINNFLNQIIYVASFLPPGSSLPPPLIELVACSRSQSVHPKEAGTKLLQTALIGGTDDGGNTPGDLMVRVYCLKDGQIAIVSDESTYLTSDNIVAALIPQNVLVAAGATFACSECTYFLLKGIVAEPFGWLGVGAVKNLIVCILFYWLMEKVKERQRELNENRRRHKRHEKQIRQIDQRLRDISMYERRLERKNRHRKPKEINNHSTLEVTSSNPFDVNTSYVLLGHQFSQLTLTSQEAASHHNTVLFRNAMGDTQYTINDAPTRNSLGHETQHSSVLSDTLQTQQAQEPLFSPLLRLPRTFNKDVSKISEEERELEKYELKRELERSRSAITRNREEREVIQKGRWWCSRTLPNPISLYARMVAAMGRFRRLEDRRLQVNRIKDNFVYKEFTPESLVEMLTAILGESAENRAQVVSFAHFYQWNLCDNRQWVIREHVDEQSQFASTEVVEGMENELLTVQQQLQDVYVMYKMAFEGNLTVDASQPFVIGDYPLSKSESPLLSSADKETATNQSSSKPQSRHNSDSSEDSDSDSDTDEQKPLKGQRNSGDRERERVKKSKQSPQGSPTTKFSPRASSDQPDTVPPPYPTLTRRQKVKSIRQQRRQRLEQVEEQFRQAAQRQYTENVKDLNRISKQFVSSSLNAPSARRAVQQVVAENLTRNIYFQGMDAYAQPLHRKTNGPSTGFFGDGKAGASTTYVRLDGSSALVEHSRNIITPSSPGHESQTENKPFTTVLTLSPNGNQLMPPSISHSSSAALRDALTDVENRTSRAGSVGGSHPPSTRTLGTESQYETEDELPPSEPDAELTKALAQHELFRLLEVFNHCHDLKPHCFEYASLPSRKIDDKLLPSPLLIIFSLLETIITLSIYAWDVFARTYNGRDGDVRPFDIYQCVFFMAFNSSLPSSLIVNVIARADLGKTTHTKNALEKVKDIITNPYVVLSIIIFIVPIVTHVIPGFVAYIWLLGPALGISCALEYYLRTRITVHSHTVIVARLFVRVVVLFTVAVVMSLSFNYSTTFLWGGKGYLATGSYIKGSYWDVVVNDYTSRSFKCTWDNILFAVSNFIQMGFLFL